MWVLHRLYTTENVLCAVPEDIHTPPSEEIGISWGLVGGRGGCDTKPFKEMYGA